VRLSAGAWRHTDLSTGQQCGGTLGMVLTSNGVDRWLLTCLHVLARTNGQVVPADRVFQPDAAHGAIATLATARVDPALDCAAVLLTVLASDEVIDIGRLAASARPVVGTRVIKSGWKTGVPEGRVQLVSGSDVFIERLPGYPPEYLLAGGGDSGAVWVDAATLAPVALHKRETAVGPHLALATDFRAVLSALHLQQV
jgi:hypothetical protein